MSDANNSTEEPTEDSLKFNITMYVPVRLLTSMSYDTFLAYVTKCNEEVTRQFHDAAIDKWFEAQPLYQENNPLKLEAPVIDPKNIERGYN